MTSIGAGVGIMLFFAIVLGMAPASPTLMLVACVLMGLPLAQLRSEARRYEEKELQEPTEKDRLADLRERVVSGELSYEEHGKLVEKVLRGEKTKYDSPFPAPRMQVTMR